MKYDAIGRLTAVVEASGGRTEYAYDRRGNLIERKDAEGRLWRQEYDVLNRLTKEIDPLGFETSYAYDALGNLASRLDANGTLLQYQYQVNLLEAILDGDGNVLSQWTYDSLGRRQTAVNADVSLEYQYDVLSRPSAVINHTLAKTLDYAYDANGNREVMVGPKGPIEYFYDARNQLVEMRDPATGTYRFEYDALGRRTRLAYPNGVDTRYTYDVASRLLTLITSNSQGEILDGYAYTYDAYGNRITMRNLRNQIDDTYQYDTLNRLVRWERGSDRFEAYTYDNVGNRTRLEDENGTVTYTYDDGDRLLTEVRTRTDGSVEETVYGWDAVGQMVSRTDPLGSTDMFSFDAVGRLVELRNDTDLVDFAYDPMGARHSRSEDTGETESYQTDPFAEGGLETVVGVTSTNGDVTVLYGPLEDEPLGVAFGEDARYLAKDGLHSVTALLDEDQSISGHQSYSPFGIEENSGTTMIRLSFTGREKELEGIMYFRARYYEPRTGRFLSRDPFKGVEHHPSSQNRFSYVEGDPVNNRDPSGLVLARVFGIALLYAGFKGVKSSFDFMAQETVALSLLEGKKEPLSVNGVITAAGYAAAIFVWGFTVMALVAYFLVYMSTGVMFLTHSGRIRSPSSLAPSILGKQFEDALKFAGSGPIRKSVLLSVVCATGLRPLSLTKRGQISESIGTFMGGCFVGTLIFYSQLTRQK